MRLMINTPSGECAFFLPDTCPHCATGIAPNIHATYYSEATNSFSFILSCPICKQVFFSTHNLCKNLDGSLLSIVKHILPHQRPVSKIPAMFQQDYPYFFQIYEQAAEAESHGLDKLSGMAYRKALEILVKQYLIKQTPDEENAILNETLGKNINRIYFEKIRVLAKAISWIGNDQTHAVQKHPDYNVPEMKRFMLALCHLISAEYVADEAAGFVSS